MNLLEEFQKERALIIMQDQYLGLMSLLYEFQQDDLIPYLRVYQGKITCNSELFNNNHSIIVNHHFIKNILKDALGYNYIDFNQVNKDLVDESYEQCVISYMNFASTPLNDTKIRIPILEEDNINLIQGSLISPDQYYFNKTGEHISYTDDIWQQKLNFVYYMICDNNVYMNKYIQSLINYKENQLTSYYFRYNFNLYNFPTNNEEQLKYAIKMIRALWKADINLFEKIFKQLSKLPIDIATFILKQFITGKVKTTVPALKQIRQESINLWNNFQDKFFSEFKKF